MASDHEREANQAAVRRLREEINRTYPRGRFVAIAEGRIFADGANLDDLLAALRAVGKDPRDAVAVRAGDFPPEYAAILATGDGR